MKNVNPFLLYTFLPSTGEATLCPDGIEVGEVGAIPRVGESIWIVGHKTKQINGCYEVKFVNWDLQMEVDGEKAQRHRVTVELENIR